MPENNRTDVDSTDDSNKRDDQRFDVALSFAGDNKRDVVREIAILLQDKLGPGRVFFDEFFEAELAGTDADSYLQKIYGEDSKLVVSCVCERYDEKPWTKAEWRAIRARIADSDQTPDARLGFLPLRFGDGEVDGIFSSLDIVPDVRNRSREETATLILDRLALIGGSEFEKSDSLPTPTPTKPKAPWFIGALVLVALIGWGYLSFPTPDVVPVDSVRQKSLLDVATKLAEDLADNESVDNFAEWKGDYYKFTFTMDEDSTDSFFGKTFKGEELRDIRFKNFEIDAYFTGEFSKLPKFKGQTVNVFGKVKHIDGDYIRGKIEIIDAMFVDLPAGE